MRQLKLIITILFLLLAISACSEDNPVENEAADPAEGLTKIAEYSFSDTLATLYTDAEIETGYCKFYLKLTKVSDNSPIENAAVSMKTLMDMGTMKHSSPMENPASNHAVNGLFECAAVFIMSGMWEVTFVINEGSEFTTSLDVSATERVRNIVGSDDKTYFVTLIEPMKPLVGMNDFEVCVHQRESMTSFPAVEDVNIVMTPSMPSMGHGSPNNENPVHKQNGHYLGKVNFTMTGDWLVELYLSRADSLLVTSFDITL
ncbi:MAG: hypothetical protein GXO87_09850 [Chlorobi bacterium]|nr:hypothetical protein [Chlorobiota bacterium]